MWSSEHSGALAFYIYTVSRDWTQNIRLHSKCLSFEPSGCSTLRFLFGHLVPLEEGKHIKKCNVPSVPGHLHCAFIPFWVSSLGTPLLWSPSWVSELAYMLLLRILHSLSPRRILLELPILYVSFPSSLGYGEILVRMILHCPVCPPPGTLWLHSSFFTFWIFLRQGFIM